MSGVLSGYEKVDIAIVPSTISGAGETVSSYFPMKNYEKAIFIVEAGSMTASGNVALRILSGRTSSGDAIAVGVHTTMNGTPTDAATITKAIEVVMLGSSQAGFALNKTITINGTVFTFVTSCGDTYTPSTASFAATRYVCSSSNLATPWDTIAHLAAYVNHATYGCTGVVATISAATSYLTFSATPPGEKALTIAFSSSGVTAWPSKTIGTLEVHGQELSLSSSQSHIAVGVTPSTDQKVSAVLVRGGARYSPNTTDLVTAYSRGTTA